MLAENKAEVAVLIAEACGRYDVTKADFRDDIAAASMTPHLAKNSSGLQTQRTAPHAAPNGARLAYSAANADGPSHLAGVSANGAIDPRNDTVQVSVTGA